MSQIPPDENPYLAKSIDPKPGAGGADTWGEPPRTSGKAIASLVLSFLSVFFCGIPGIIALILGFNGLSEIKHSQGRLKGSGFATSGIVIAFVSFALLMMAVPVLLLLPAINAAREAARRNVCMSNIRQDALAAANHEATTMRYPLGTTANVPFAGEDAALPGQADGEQAAGYSFQVKLLPYMEERIFFDEILQSSDRMSVPAFDSSVSAFSQHPAQQQLPVFRCPSYAGEPIATAPEYERAIGNVAVGNYVGIPGTHINADGTLEENGVLISGASREGGKGVKIREISDGVSKTFLVCESREARYGSWYDGQATWVTALKTSVNENSFGRGQFDDFPTAPPDSLALNFGPDRYGESEGYFPADRYAGELARDWGPSSDHGGGVILHGFLDAHAQAISSDVDPTVYMQFVTRAGGEPAMGLDW